MTDTDNWRKADEHTLTLRYHYDGEGGATTDARTLLEAVWELHYRVIAAHRDGSISQGSMPVCRASQELVKALIGEVFDAALIGELGWPRKWSINRIYDVMREIGEVPTVQTLKDY